MLKTRLEEYNNFLSTVEQTLEQEYQYHLIRINATDEPHKVFQNLCEAVEKPANVEWNYIESRAQIVWLNFKLYLRFYVIFSNKRFLI